MSSYCADCARDQVVANNNPSVRNCPGGNISYKSLRRSARTLSIEPPEQLFAMRSLSDLPVELVLDHLLPNLPVRDLLALGATNHQYATLCDDELLWKERCKQDFNFSSSRTARTKGWKFIYKGLRNPKVFVWG